MTMRIHAPTHGERVFIKGAPEVLLGMCSRELVENHVCPLDDTVVKHGRKRMLDWLRKRCEC